VCRLSLSLSFQLGGCPGAQYVASRRRTISLERTTVVATPVSGPALGELSSLAFRAASASALSPLASSWVVVVEDVWGAQYVGSRRRTSISEPSTAVAVSSLGPALGALGCKSIAPGPSLLAAGAQHVPSWLTLRRCAVTRGQELQQALRCVGLFLLEGAPRGYGWGTLSTLLYCSLLYAICYQGWWSRGLLWPATRKT
jgi:hypothetical protein